MSKFKTLLLREWMQHHRGWLILALVPLLIAVVTIPFGSVQTDQPHQPQQLALFSMGGYIVGVLVLAWLSVMIQTPGMARRDQQDRSIEFWVSLPVKHWQSVLATVSMHALLMPLMVLALAFVSGQVVAAMLVVKMFGPGALLQIPFGAWITASAVVLLRFLFGVVVCSLWLSPLLLLGMAAAAWLKRWGVPIVAAAIGIGGGLLAKLYDNNIVFDIVDGLFVRAASALVPGSHDGGGLDGVFDLPDVLRSLPDWALHDAGLIAQDLLSPNFVAAMLASVAFFGLLVLRRQRGA